VWPNETLRKQSDHQENALLQGCFYKGTVRGDEKSRVAVSLCDGMVSEKIDYFELCCLYRDTKIEVTLRICSN
jgi:hypothetical protein